MATIALNRSQQSKLGQASDPIDLKAYRLRQKAQEQAFAERRWLQEDTPPVKLDDRASIDQLRKGTPIIERIASYRTGTVTGFGFLIGYGKTPIVDWGDRGGKSFALPEWVSLQAQQLSLF